MLHLCQLKRCHILFIIFALLKRSFINNIEDNHLKTNLKKLILAGFLSFNAKDVFANYWLITPTEVDFFATIDSVNYIFGKNPHAQGCGILKYSEVVKYLKGLQDITPVPLIDLSDEILEFWFNKSSELISDKLIINIESKEGNFQASLEQLNVLKFDIEEIGWNEESSKVFMTFSNCQKTCLLMYVLQIAVANLLVAKAISEKGGNLEIIFKYAYHFYRMAVLESFNLGSFISHRDLFEILRCVAFSIRCALLGKKLFSLESSFQEAFDNSDTQKCAEISSSLASVAKYARRFDMVLSAAGGMPEGETEENALKCCVCNLIFCPCNYGVDFLLPFECKGLPEALLSHAICSDCWKSMADCEGGLSCPICRST